LHEPDLIDLARRLIETPSVTTEGTRALAERLGREVLAQTDLTWRLEPGDDPEQVNLIAVKGLGPTPPILLNSHLDTVPPGDASLWTACQGDPFRPSLRGGDLYGLGAADAKLDWLCKALALRRWNGRRFSRGVIFVGTFGEEGGLRGARALLPRLPRHPAAAWVGEPTELHVVTRHKGLLVVRVTACATRASVDGPKPATRIIVRGRAAHSSTPDHGENAILGALDLARRRGLRILAARGGDAVNKVPAQCEIDVVSQAWVSAQPFETVAVPAPPTPLTDSLGHFLFDLASEQQRILALADVVDPSFSPPGLTSNFGWLFAEGSRVEATLDFRCLPGEPSQLIIEALERFAEEQRRRRPLNVKIDVERDNPPLHTPADAAVVRASLAALAALGRPLDLGTKAGCTEAGVYAVAGIPSVVFGPGRAAGNIHAPNEHVPVAELDEAIEFYARIVAEHCG
jgi:acetylornithine deacetylase/succinyl-diaminopimelate desuccinylase-like protein